MCPKYMTADCLNLKIHTGSKEMVISFNLKCYLFSELVPKLLVYDAKR